MSSFAANAWNEFERGGADFQRLARASEGAGGAWQVHAEPRREEVRADIERDPFRGMLGVQDVLGGAGYPPQLQRLARDAPAFVAGDPGARRAEPADVRIWAEHFAAPTRAVGTLHAAHAATPQIPEDLGGEETFAAAAAASGPRERAFRPLAPFPHPDEAAAAAAAAAGPHKRPSPAAKALKKRPASSPAGAGTPPPPPTLKREAPGPANSPRAVGKRLRGSFSSGLPHLSQPVASSARPAPSASSSSSSSSSSHNAADGASGAAAAPSTTSEGTVKCISAFRGVSWHKRDRRWLARLWVDGKIRYLGSYSDEEEAALAVDLCAIKYFGENTPRINFTQEKREQLLKTAKKVPQF